jgi:hypothetical protein
MKPICFVLLATSLGLTACGSVVIVDDPGKPSTPPDTSGMPTGNPWTAPDGVAAPLPANGSTPGVTSTVDPNGDAWSGWWVRFPSFGVTPMSIATLDGDVVIGLVGPAADFDLGEGPLAPDLDPERQIAVMIRLSATGKLLWAKRLGDPPYADLIVDAASRIQVTTPHGFQTYDGAGQLLGERKFGEGVTVMQTGIAPTAEGGLLLGLAVESGDVDLGAGPIALTGAAPLGLLVRLDAQGNPTSWHEANGAGGVAGVGVVGEDSAGNVFAFGGNGQPIWDGTPIGPAYGSSYVTSFDAGGKPLWASTLTAPDGYIRAMAVPQGKGMLVTGDAHSPISFNGVNVPYEKGPYGDGTGLALRVDDSGQLESTLELGPRVDGVAAGPDHLVVATTTQPAPVTVVWCSKGVAPCDRYAMGDTDAIANVVTVGLDPTIAYVAGSMRLTPGGNQMAQWQLYVMKVVH